MRRKQFLKEGSWWGLSQWYSQSSQALPGTFLDEANVGSHRSKDPVTKGHCGNKHDSSHLISMFQWLRCKCFRGRCAKCKLTSMLEQGNTSTCSSGNRISLLPPLVISPMKSPNLFGEVNPTGTPTTFHHKQPNQP